MKDKLINPITAIIIGLSLILSTFIAMDGIKSIKTDNTLVVKGSSSFEIKSDIGIWEGQIYAENKDRRLAFLELENQEKMTIDFLETLGIKKEQIAFSPIGTTTYNVILENGTYTNIIDRYKLYKNIKIQSNNVELIDKIYKESTNLISDGVMIQSYNPTYYYTGLADLKADAINKATKDAKERAEKMLEATGNKLGNLKSAKVGIFQITPQYSTEISDYGINDTSSIYKVINSVVTCTFEIK
ncbi:MAG: SIMPL domain-containing protein [Firmicutes bacterium]|jgi:hypothetical protein|nr:SIMPL domain-containing protein [Bacillota bacterium]